MAALVLLAGACGEERSPDRPHAGEEQPPDGGTAVVAESSDMAMPVPFFIQTVIDGDMQDVVFLGLLRTGWDQDEGRQVSTAEENPMAIARAYEYLGTDSTTIRFHLRSDLRWSDGVPLTAHDVVWTYRTMADPDFPTPRRDYVEHMDSVVANDDSTVTFHFRRHYPEMLFHTGHGVVPRHVYESVPLDRIQTHPSVGDPAAHLVFSGPFRIARWDRGQQIVLERNPHFRPQPRLERIVVRIIPDESTRLVELRTGNIDAMRVSSPANLRLLEGDTAIRLDRIERRFSEFVAYDPTVEPFDDPEIRRALGLAVNVPALIEALDLSTYADPAAGPYSPIFRDMSDDSLAPLPYDPERARTILEEKGWVDEDGDGIRELEGRPFSFTLATNSGNPRRADLATLLQSAWRSVGVDARVQLQEFQSFSARLFEKEFEAAIYGWQVSLAPDISGMWDPDALMNFVSYREPQLQETMREALEQRTAGDAVPYWQAAARLIARDQPYTWLYYMDQVVALRNRLQGPEIDTFGMYQNTWEWWVRP